MPNVRISVVEIVEAIERLSAEADRKKALAREELYSQHERAVSQIALPPFTHLSRSNQILLAAFQLKNKSGDDATEFSTRQFAAFFADASGLTLNGAASYLYYLRKAGMLQSRPDPNSRQGVRQSLLWCLSPAGRVAAEELAVAAQELCDRADTAPDVITDDTAT